MKRGLVLVLLTTSLASAQELSPPVRLDPRGYTTKRYALSDDGRRAAMDCEVNFKGHLFLRDVDGRPARAVTGPALPSVTGIYPRFTPDGGHVLYYTDFAHVYHSVPVDFSASPMRIGPTSGISQLVFTPDGTAALFIATENLRPELFRQAIDGSTPAVRLSKPLTTFGNVIEVVLTPDGLVAVYRAVEDTPNVIELYRVPVDGSAPPVKISPPVNAGGGGAFRFTMSADGSTVVILGDFDVAGLRELYSVPLDGSAPPLKISSTFGGLAGSILATPTISPDATFVVYRQDNAVSAKQALFRVPLLGGPIVALSAAVRRIDSVSISPDSRWVGWISRLGDAQVETVEALLIPSDASSSASAALLDRYFIDQSFPRADYVELSPDSRFALHARTISGNVQSTSVLGGPPNLLNGGASYRAQTPLLHDRIYYENGETLYATRIDGSEPPQQISPSLSASGLLADFAFCANGRTLLYRIWNDAANDGTWARWLLVGIDAVAPRGGPASGGSAVTIRGHGFSPDTRVYFGDVAATAVQFVSESRLIALSPPRALANTHHAGLAVDVRVEDLLTEDTLAHAFWYRR